MTPIAKMLATLLFGTAIAGAPLLAQVVTIDYDHTVNFSKFRSYTWGKVHATDPGVEQRITSAVNRDLTGRYMHEVSKGSDVTIAAVEATQDKQEYATFYDSMSEYSWQRGWGSAGFLDSAATLQDIPVDTLILDMYDTNTHKLLWRGTITLSPSDVAGKGADLKADKAFTTLVGKYPPKYSKSN